MLDALPGRQSTAAITLPLHCHGMQWLCSCQQLNTKSTANNIHRHWQPVTNKMAHTQSKHLETKDSHMQHKRT